MSIIIDLILLGILVLSIFFGYKKGLTKCIIKILSFFIAIVVASIFFKPVSNLVIQNTQIDETIKESIVGIVKNNVEENGEVTKDSNLPQAMVKYINETINNSVEQAKNSVIEVIAEEISNTIINVGVAIALFIVIRIILIFVSLLSKFITDLPIIKQFDKSGGIIYGALRALIIMFVVFALISIISPLIEQTGIVVAINKSFIGSIIYNNNILLKMIF